MLFRLDGYVVARVGDTAILQLDGGMITVSDLRGELVGGQPVVVEGHSTAEAAPRGLPLGAYATEYGSVTALGLPVLLRPLLNGRYTPAIPLVLSGRRQLPATFLLTASPTEPTPDLEGGGDNPDDPQHSNPVGEPRSSTGHPLHVSPDQVAAIVRGRQHP